MTAIVSGWRIRKAATAATTNASEAALVPLEPETVERLASLGYVGGVASLERRAGPRPERRLAAAAAERAGDVAAAPLLQKDRHQQHQADHHVEDRHQVLNNHGYSLTPGERPGRLPRQHGRPSAALWSGTLRDPAQSLKPKAKSH